jgi:hypothetical protein
MRPWRAMVTEVRGTRQRWEEVAVGHRRWPWRGHGKFRQPDGVCEEEERPNLAKIWPSPRPYYLYRAWFVRAAGEWGAPTNIYFILLGTHSYKYSANFYNCHLIILYIKIYLYIYSFYIEIILFYILFLIKIIFLKLEILNSKQLKQFEDTK